jgi:hypothetical protein
MIKMHTPAFKSLKDFRGCIKKGGKRAYFSLFAAFYKHFFRYEGNCKVPSNRDFYPDQEYFILPLFLFYINLRPLPTSK